MEHITLNTNKVVFGVDETMKLLEEQAVEKLIVHDDLIYQKVDLVPVDIKNGKD